MKTLFGTVIYPNGMKYFNEFLHSIKSQTTENFSLLLLNDGVDINEIENLLIDIELSVLTEIVACKKNLSPDENRRHLIKEAMIRDVDLLVIGDMDDTFSETRIQHYIKAYDPAYGFFYNDLIYKDDGQHVFREIPDYITEVETIMESNFLGMSTTGINIKALDYKDLDALDGKGIEIYDWFLYSKLLLMRHKGKKINNAVTYYRVHENNTVGKKFNVTQTYIEEIKVKLCLYEQLSEVSKKHKDLLKRYQYIYKCIQAGLDIYKYCKNSNGYWWGGMNSALILKEISMIEINGSRIENFKKPFVIAEIGSNHNGDMDLAKQMIDAAVECGVDAVKFQSWTDKSLIAKEEYDRNQSYDDSPKKHFGSLEEMVKKYYLREEQHYSLKKYCDAKGVIFCSTPFSIEEVDLLEDVGVPFFKVASMDVTNLRLLRSIAKKDKPIILSTGMASISEIEQAVSTIEGEGNYKIVILHCISIYPPKAEDIHLNNIKMLQKMYPNYPIGFSDHTIGTSIPIAAITLGAAVIEKHFTLDKDLPGWDHEVSANPEEMSYIVREGAIVSSALGSLKRIVSDDEEAKKEKFRRSIVLTRDIGIGELISESDITFKRPGSGIAPDEEKYVVGRKMKVDKKSDDLLLWSDLE